VARAARRRREQADERLRTLDSLEAVFGVGTIVPANVGPYVVNLALQNTTTEINFTGLSADFLTTTSRPYQSMRFEFLENKDVYGLALC
jgi:hypothetical protein